MNTKSKQKLSLHKETLDRLDLGRIVAGKGRLMGHGLDTSMYIENCDTLNFTDVCRKDGVQ